MGRCIVVGIRVGPDRGKQSHWPAVDLNTNFNFFVAFFAARTHGDFPCESAQVLRAMPRSYNRPAQGSPSRFKARHGALTFEVTEFSGELTEGGWGR